MTVISSDTYCEVLNSYQHNLDIIKNVSIHDTTALLHKSKNKE